MKKTFFTFGFKLILPLCALILSGCTTIKLDLLTGKNYPLKEYTLKGTGKNKILIIPITGVISNQGNFSLIAEHPGMLENIITQLQYAENDDNIKALLLKINSPGGLTTASDILYNEIEKFKKKTGKTVVVSMMDFAASGAYMISLPADLITAHPTTVTGSVGVIFMRPRFSGLMDKLGIKMDVSKSGRNKDMGSPFRQPLPEENKLFQNVIDKLNTRFLSLVKKHRKIDEKNMKEISTARIFLAEDAETIGLIDKICYLDEALAECKKLADIPANSRVIIYRRKYYPDDNIYNTSLSSYKGPNTSLIKIGILEEIGNMKCGFYSIWPGALANGE